VSGAATYPSAGADPHYGMTPEGWSKRTPADWPELRKSPRPVIAQWVGSEPGTELLLYEDGSFEGFGVPVELVPYVQAEWFNHQRGRIA
jgi:hypothetical protein